MNKTIGSSILVLYFLRHAAYFGSTCMTACMHLKKLEGYSLRTGIENIHDINKHVVPQEIMMSKCAIQLFNNLKILKYVIKNAQINQKPNHCL